LINIGHLKRLFDPLGFAFHESLVENYGGVVKLNGLFGVCVVFLITDGLSDYWDPPQAEQLYVTDPRALNHIVMHDGDIFDILP
jgi:hypothetical protein